MTQEQEIDRLFQLPLNEFTPARNALAKAAGKGGAPIRDLSKPPLAAWAVNQLFWHDRDTFETLIDTATEMRRTHRAVIEGKSGDLRSAGREHDIALEAALKSTLSILEESGNPVSDATRQSILNTLRALPGDEPPGRLTKTLAPGGFEMLAGVTANPAPKRANPREVRPAAGKTSTKEAETQAARQREERAAAERAVRDADQKARRAEFDLARAARDASKAARRLEEARNAFEEAEGELESAKGDAANAERERDAAERRSREAQDALDAARRRLKP